MSLSIVVVTSPDGDTLDILTSDAAAKKFVGQHLDHLSFIVSDLSSIDMDRHLNTLMFPAPVMDQELLLGLFNQDKKAVKIYAGLL
jgi:hypothetical protein